MRKRPSLSQEMDALFPEQEGEREVAGGLKLVDRARIRTAEQPRASFPPAEIEELASSIRDLHAQQRGVAGSGLLQPLLVRVAPDGQGYILIAGERRLRASALAGVQRLPVVVASGEYGEKDQPSLLLLQLAENMQRQDLPPLEEARGIQALMEAQGLSVREVARLLGKDKGYIQNRIFLLKAGPDVQEMVTQRSGTLRHARLIAGVEDPARRARLIRAVLEEDASLATLERLHSASAGSISGQPSEATQPATPPLAEEIVAVGSAQKGQPGKPTASTSPSKEAVASPASTPQEGAERGQRRTQKPAAERPDPLEHAVRPAAAHLAEAARQLGAMKVTRAYGAELRREIAAVRAQLDEIEAKLA